MPPPFLVTEERAKREGETLLDLGTLIIEMLQQSHQAQPSISSGQILCPFLKAYTQHPAEPHKHDGTHTRCLKMAVEDTHPKNLNPPQWHPLSERLSRHILQEKEREKMRRWREGDVGERAWRSLGCCG